MLSLPSFLTTTPTSSLTFKTDTHNGLARLYTEPIPSSDHRYYSSLVTHFTTSSHVFEIFSVKDARLIRDRQPGNFRTLVRLLVGHLEALLVDPEFAKHGEQQRGGGEATTMGLGLGRWTGGGKNNNSSPPRDRTREALNCARLLARLLPVLMEEDPTTSKDTFTSKLEDDILWSTVDHNEEDFFSSNTSSGSAKASTSATQPADSTPSSESEEQFVIDDEEEEADEEKSLPQASPQPPPTAAPHTIRPLIHRLLDLCLSFLFLPEFTLPPLPPEEEEDDATLANTRSRFVIWEKGVGSSVGLPNTTRTHINHRVEFLRLALVLLSKSTYVPPPSQPTFQDGALQYFCTALNQSTTLPVLCSLLNTAMSEGNSSDWASYLNPAGGNKEGTLEGREILRVLSFQVLAVVLQWGLDSCEESEKPSMDRSASTTSINSTGASAATATTPTANQFTHWLSKIHRVADLALLTDSLFHALQPSNRPLLFSLPSSEQHPSHGPEAMTLLWILLRCNAKFRTYVLGNSDGIDNEEDSKDSASKHTRAYGLLSLLLSHALLGKDTPSTHGIVRLSLFILQDVSFYPAFSHALSLRNSASHVRLPPKFHSTLSVSSCKTASDLTINAFYTLLTTKGMGSSVGGLGLHPVILLALCNISTHIHHLSIPSSTRLSLLLTQFSSATYLLSDEGNPRNLYFLLESINAVLQANAQRNENFVYALLGRKKEADRLKSFSLLGAVAEIRRKRGVVVGGVGSRRDASASATPSATVDSSASTASNAPTSAEEEKRRLAERDQQAGESPGEASEDAVEDGSTPRVPSQKALGKVRRTSGASADEAAEVPTTTTETSTGDPWLDSLSPEELSHAASTLLNLSPDGHFQPTQEWISTWVPYLPLAPLESLHKALLPEMETLCSSEVVQNKADADVRVLSWLREKDVSEVVRGAGESNTRRRRFKWTRQVSIWLLSYIWGAVYVLHLNVALWPAEGMRLFYLVQPRVSQQQQQGPAAAAGAGMTTTLLSPFSNAFGAVFGGAGGMATNSQERSSAGQTSQEV